MGLDMQELLQECNITAVNRKRSSIRKALNRYKYSSIAPKRYGRSTPEERKFFEDAMRKYKEFATTDEQKRAYNILACYYFATKTLTDLQLAKLFHIEKRAVYKSIAKGVNDLTLLIFGVDGIIFNDDDSPIWHAATLGRTVKKGLEKPEALLDAKAEVLKMLRSEFVSYIREKPEIDLMGEMEAMDAWIKGQKSASTTRAEIINSEKEENERRQKERYPYVKAALGALREGKAAPEVKEIFVKAMENYKDMARGEKHETTYNVLLRYFFSSQPPTGKHIARMLNFNLTLRTLYKIIEAGIYDLTAIVYGFKGAAEIIESAKKEKKTND